MAFLYKSSQGDPLAGHRSAYVLVVDDDCAIREALEEVLVGEGYVVRVAADGRAGLEVCASLPVPDLILLDLAMPVMDGHELSRRQQESAALASIPVCLMTAAGASSLLPTSACAMLRKPFELDDLIAIIKRFCG